MTTDNLVLPALRDPNIAEWFVRLGHRHAVETADVLVRLDDRRLRREARLAARKAVAGLARAYERTFLSTLESALATPAGGALRTTIHLGEGNDVVVEHTIGAANG